VTDEKKKKKKNNVVFNSEFVHSSSIRPKYKKSLGDLLERVSLLIVLSIGYRNDRARVF
jgi:hypothetical protein